MEYNTILEADLHLLPDGWIPVVKVWLTAGELVVVEELAAKMPGPRCVAVHAPLRRQGVGEVKITIIRTVIA